MPRIFHNTRVSICRECRCLLAADHVEDEEGVFLEKHCPDHGFSSTRIAADYSWLAGLQEFSAHSFEPLARQTTVDRGCPWDCGECPGHRQKSAFFLFEITDTCDLNCPICLGAPKEHGSFISVDDCEKMASAVLSHAGPGQIVTLGGGEPTTHPRFFELVEALKSRGFDELWVYTNGRRIAGDPAFAQRLAKEGLHVVLQWDGFDDAVYARLRGTSLLDEKRQALGNLKSAGARLGLCTTVAAGVNEGQLGEVYSMFAGDPGFGLLDIATMAFVGKGATSHLDRERRITSQDVLLALEGQTAGVIKADDFSPVSFSHPECLQIAYLLAEPDGGFVPLRRFLDAEDYRALIADRPLLALDAGIEGTFRAVIDKLWASRTDDPFRLRGLAALRHVIEVLFGGSGPLPADELQARARRLVKVVLVHSYMDGLNFDVGRSKACISRTVLPDGRLMPTCAYNVVHRQ
jgi:hypothetical protein